MRVRPREDQRQRRLLRFVQPEHLGHEDRAEVGDACAHGDSVSRASQREELNGEGRGLPRLTEGGDAGGQLLGGLARLEQSRQIALDVCDEHGDAGSRKPLRHELEGARLARAGGARHESVAVEHSQRHSHERTRFGRAVFEISAEGERRRVEGVSVANGGCIFAELFFSGVGLRRRGLPGACGLLGCGRRGRFRGCRGAAVASLRTFRRRSRRRRIVRRSGKVLRRRGVPGSGRRVRSGGVPCGGQGGVKRGLSGVGLRLGRVRSSLCGLRP